MPNRLRVILVEDSEDDSILIQQEISKAGYELFPVRVETPEEMEAALKEPGCDLVISDHAMPRFSAPAALKILHESGLDIPFIVVSGAIGEELAVGLMHAGAHDFVMKDRLGRLGPAIERELGEAQVRREYRNSMVEQRGLSLLIEKEHQLLQQKINEVGALNRLFQQRLGEMDQAESKHRDLLRGLGNLIHTALDPATNPAKLPAEDLTEGDGPVVQGVNEATEHRRPL